MYLSERATRLDAMIASPPASLSPAHRLDPRARLGCAILLGTGAVLSPSLTLATIWFAVAVGCLLAFRATRLRAYLSLNIFMACVWLSLPLTVDGTVLAQWGPLHVSLEGVRLAALLTLKANASLGFLIALCGGMTTTSVGAALQRLGIANALITLFMLLCRHLDTLGESYRLSLHALRLRGQNLSCRQRLYVFACLVGSVLVHATDDAERVRMAMLCKHGGLRYDVTAHLHWQTRDTLICLAAGLLCLLLYAREGADLVAGF